MWIFAVSALAFKVEVYALRIQGLHFWLGLRMAQVFDLL